MVLEAKAGAETSVRDKQKLAAMFEVQGMYRYALGVYLHVENKRKRVVETGKVRLSLRWLGAEDPYELASDVPANILREIAAQPAWTVRANPGAPAKAGKKAPRFRDSDSDAEMKWRRGPKASAVARPVNKAPGWGAVIAVPRSGSPSAECLRRATPDVLDEASPGRLSLKESFKLKACAAIRL